MNREIEPKFSFKRTVRRTALVGVAGLLASADGVAVQALPPLSPAEFVSSSEIVNFIENNQVPLNVGLLNILKSSRIALVGDRHTPSGEKLRNELVSVLPVLKDQGGLNTVGVELDSSLQRQVDQLNPADPTLETKIRNVAPVGWYDGNTKFLATVKRLGLKVICLDLIKKGQDTENASWQNQRDKHMFDIFQNATMSKDKVLILIGQDHIHKRSVKSYDDGSITGLGMHLTKRYGDKQVSAVRVVSRDSEDTFNGLLFFQTSGPKVSEVVKKDDPVIIVPDKGPVKGDPRVTAADYLIIA